MLCVLIFVLYSIRYEDGTVSFLDILALKYGFESLQQFRLTMSIISKHTFTLSSHVYNTMVSMIHDNGSPLCLLYHTRDSFTDINKQGGIVTFNLLRKDGSVIGYSEVGTYVLVVNHVTSHVITGRQNGSII